MAAGDVSNQSAAAAGGGAAATDKAFYSKPGQAKPTPSNGSGDRVFYDSLYKENPKSAIALVWLIEQGCFDMEEQKRLYPAYLKAKEVVKERNRVSAASASKSLSATAQSPERGRARHRSAVMHVDDLSAVGVAVASASVGGTQTAGATTI